jgi:hypothetical protein
VDHDTGRILLSLAIAESGPGYGMQPDYLGFYPYHALEHAREDGQLAAVKLGLRMRVATPDRGWTYESCTEDYPTPESLHSVL